MKRSIMTLTVLLAAAAMVAAFSSPESAWAVSGRCDNCHTMHYSQGGTSMVTGWGTTGPYGKLLTNDCMGCHTTPTPGDPFDGTTPFVAGTSLTDDACLAGGFFPTTMVTDDNNLNDHHGIGNENAPAGFDSSDNTWYTGTTGGVGLGCAGSNGCHGNETDLNDLSALSGGHHNVSASYRMLYVGSDPVEGEGAKDYEEAIIDDPATTPETSGSGQNVNIYCAGTATGSEATINALCAKCHGVFHGENSSSDTDGTKNIAGEWIRHPTENTIPTTWAIGSLTYELDGDDYKDNPVGYDAATIDLDEKRVVCMSCHRAHGTDNADLLRWPYSEMLAGQGTPVTHGCLGCHDAQR